jgi:outer membrane protein assembly factor BamB
VCSYEPDTGRELWRVHYPLGYSVVPRPLYAHGLVYVCSGFDTPRLIAFRPTGSGDITEAQVAWTKRESVPNSPTPIIVGDELYMVNDKGIASCLDARTGKQHWRKRIGGNYSASPIYAEGKIYFQSETGKGVVIRAAKAFTLLAENDLNDRTLASYAVDDGVLFIRSETHLYRIEEND